jgi:hypothetical protein
MSASDKGYISERVRIMADQMMVNYIGNNGVRHMCADTELQADSRELYTRFLLVAMATQDVLRGHNE